MDYFSILGSSDLGLEQASILLKDAGISENPIALIPLAGGANNRVMRIELSTGSPLVLKSYFQHPQDPRPRLKAEFEFLSFAWEQGIRCIPQALYCDPMKNIALYTHLDATLADSEHANPTFIQASDNFLHHLNRGNIKGKHLLKAAEACFAITDYIETVEKKLKRLLATPQDRLVEIKLHLFLKDQLIPKWTEIKKDLCKSALHSLDPESEDLIITPSDFGLHNALVSSGSDFYFIDFEYAGWDDPSKTICDFFLQPKVPIPSTYFEFFTASISSMTKNPQKTIERTNLVFPICVIKWCCIILNVFLQIGKARREFANNDLAKSQEKQLEFAEKYLHTNESKNLGI